MIAKNKYIGLWLIILLIFTSPLAILSQNIALADEKTYSNVIDDLELDEDFAVEDYPVIATDYSIKIIQIAESSDNELFVYTYQPTAQYKNYIATKINMSTEVHDSNFNLYDLELLNCNSVFYKYIVKDFVVKEDSIRNYDIASIYRLFDERVDDPVKDDNGNVINQVSFEVAKLYTMSTENGQTQIKCFDTEVINVTDKYVGFVRIEDGHTGSPGIGMSWYKPGYDSHFIAFNTDKNIDKLYSATVYYTAQSYYYYRSTVLGIEINKEEKFGIVEKQEPVKIDYTDSVEIKVPNGPFEGRDYSFERIQKVSDFIETEDREWIYELGLFNVAVETKLTDKGLSEIKDKQWIIRFTETEWKDTQTSLDSTITKTKSHTIVGNVALLELKFETDGVVYDLGVVDNMQTGDGQPDNETNTKVTIPTWVWLLTALFFLTIFIFIFPNVIVAIFKLLFALVKFIFNLIKKIFIWIINLFKKGGKDG